MLVIVSDIDKFPFKAMSNILCFCTGVIIVKKTQVLNSEQIQTV